MYFLFVWDSKASDVEFVSINAVYGISLREASSVCRDDDGFIWSSSKAGILRLIDGDYRIYSLPSQSPNIGSVKLTYRSPRLYAYTSNGQLFRYDELFDRFDLIADLRALLDNTNLNTNRIAAEERGVLWIASSEGLFRLTEQDRSVERIDYETDDVHDLTLVDENELYYGTGNGLERLNIHTLESELVYKSRQVPPFRISRFYYDREQDRLWIGTVSNGLFYYDISGNLFRKANLSGFPGQPVLAIEENTDSTLLVGIDGQGIWEIDKQGERVLNIYKENADDPSSLKGNGVYDILRDPNDRIWMVTYSAGLSFFDQASPFIDHITHRINDNNSLGDNNVNRILEDRRGNLWFATNNGISRWDPATDRWDGFYQNKRDGAQVFLALCEDAGGNIWAGTYASGVYVLDRNTGRELAHFPRDVHSGEFTNRFISDIFRDSAGDIWIGDTQGEVFCYSAKENRFRSYPARNVGDFAEMAPGRILLACSYGLMLLDKDSGSVETLLDRYIVRDILIVGDDIWLATSGNGLVRYNYGARTVKAFTTESGLLSDIVNSIAYTGNDLVLATENGLCRLDLSDYSVHTYLSLHTLSALSFNVKSFTALKNGSLIWGTNNGAVLFDPAMLHETPRRGRVFFQDITIAGHSIREYPEVLEGIPVDRQTRVPLRHNQNTIGLELLPIGISPQIARFSWKMEGVDAEWSRPSTNSTPNYANLPPGDFRLDVRMYDSSFSQLLDERSLLLHINPPFWGTWWFRLILVLVAAGVVYVLLKLYINRLKQIHAEDKVRFFTTMAHDIRTSLTLVSAPIEELNKEGSLSEKGRYYLDLATEQSGRLSSVVTQLLDFQKVDIGKGQLFPVLTDIVALIRRRKAIFDAAAEKKEVTLSFSSGSGEVKSAVDEVKMERIVDNLLSNAIKYSYPGGNVEIRLTAEERSWTLEVRDHGRGISELAQKKLFREFYRGDNPVNSKIVGSGIGLLLVKNYVEMHGGEISVKSRENEGAAFKISIPYRESSETGSEPAGKEKTNGAGTGKPVTGRSAPGENERSGRPRILLVEDNSDLRDFLGSSLGENYRISVAGDGARAWEMIRKEPPDLVISDIMMPEMDGFGLCRQIKSTFETAHIPVILLTALSDKARQLEGLGLGADDYVTKPFDMAILSGRIESVVRNRETVREKGLRLVSQTGDGPPLLENELNDRFVKKALQVIRENMGNAEFGKKEFASAMHVSSSLLYNKVKALTGQSPIEMITGVRLAHASELLKSRRYTVTEVSEQCGFSSPGYFSKVFKKHLGKSPTEI